MDGNNVTENSEIVEVPVSGPSLITKGKKLDPYLGLSCFYIFLSSGIDRLDGMVDDTSMSEPCVLF